MRELLRSASVKPPGAPVYPTRWVRTVNGNQYPPPVFLIVSPDAVYRLLSKGIPIDQATGIGFVVRIVFNDLTIENTDIVFIIR